MGFLMRRDANSLRTTALLAACVALAVIATDVAFAADRDASWSIGTPIVTYWAGPTLTDAVAKQMAEGGWNLVWCGEKQLDIAQRHGLRAQLQDALLAPATLDDAGQRAKLDELIARVRNHPALYSYFIVDEPSAGSFAALGKMVAYLREHDPAHLAYINLFPTYATNEQLGTKGDPVTAYKDYLQEYFKSVKPLLLSYDHYQFAQNGDNPDYFLNLALIRRAALDAHVPFLNIVQASTWTPAMRVPGPDELRYLVYTTLAYGGQGISYYVYNAAGHTGGIALADGTPTPLYAALSTLNRQFAAIAKELQPLRSLAVYHAGMSPPGAELLPANAPFHFDPPIPSMAFKPPEQARGVVIGYFGAETTPSHVVVVNLDYKAEQKVGLIGPGHLDRFDANIGVWIKGKSERLEVRLKPGEGVLIRAATMSLDAPLDHQVIQRDSKDRGRIVIRGHLDSGSASKIEARIVTGGKAAPWQDVHPKFCDGAFEGVLGAPAGGWHRLEVRAATGDRVAQETGVEHVGVGEVFVVAGQSNSANHGEAIQQPKDDRVVNFDGENWRPADDPQPGATGSGGSFLPPFGDAIAKRFDVPVGFIACGVGGTSVREWLPRGTKIENPPTRIGHVRQGADGAWESKGDLFAKFVARMNQLGPHGFRAVLWHQGESDANQQDATRTLQGALYRTYLEELIRDSRREIGWDAPWIVAQVSYHSPSEPDSADIRSAQAEVWKDGVALEGPDTDALQGNLRERRGQGVHFSGHGLRKHAQAWFDKVAPWLDRQLK
jgi:carbohydrate esterase-like sialic acid-specific acetylesterase